MGLPAHAGPRRAADRRELAETWFEDEYVPVVETLREADLIGRGTEAEAYLRVVRTATCCCAPTSGTRT